LYDFLAPVAPQAANKAMLALIRAPDKLRILPRIGSRIAGFGDQEVRRMLVGNYEMRYQILDDVIFIIRIFHTREDRSFGEE
jgi:plasmid stabilization system protein ParE